jgi:hypothetical protein
VSQIHKPTFLSVAVLCAALALPAIATRTAYAAQRPAKGAADNDIDPSKVQEGFDASPIPKDKLNFKGKDLARIGLGSYIVNSASVCSGCHTFPQYLRPGGTVPGTNGNFTGNLTNQGSNPTFGNPYLDPPTQSLTTQLQANQNIKHFLAGGRCFGFFMSRNLTPDDSGRPRGLTEDQFIQVMRTGADVSCKPSNPHPPTYGGVVDPVCSTPEGAGAGHAFNPNVLQTMPWPTFHGMTDNDLKAVYAYLSALPQANACNTVQNGCAGFFGAAKGAGEVGTNRYRYTNTDDCPNNVAPTNKGDDGLPYGTAPPQ